MTTPTGLSRDETRVAAFTTDCLEATSRVFVPAQGPAGTAMTWRKLAMLAGVSLTADLRWSAVVSRLDPALRQELTAPFAVVPPDTLVRLVEMLSATTSTPETLLLLPLGGVRRRDGRPRPGSGPTAPCRTCP